MWFAMTVTVIALSFVPELAPDHVVFWRLSLGIPALILVCFYIASIRYLTERQSYVTIVIGAYLGTGVFGVLMQITPGIWALLLGLMVPAIFIGYFVRMRELVPLLLFVTAVALSALLSPFADAVPHFEARLAAYLAALWAMVIALYIQKKQLLAANLEVSKKTNTDPLTGLTNHRALQTRAEELLERSGRGPGTEVALLMVDLDNFKQANSLYGHLGGDLTLRCVGEQIVRVMPPGAVAARVGGDEFAILIQSGSPEKLDEFAGLVRGAIRGGQAELPLANIKLDASIGYAIAPRDGDTLGALMAAADEAMYREKASRESHELAQVLTETEERSQPQAVDQARIAWQDREIGSDESTRFNFPGGGFLRSRTDFALTTFLTFIVGCIALSIAFAIPDPGDQYVAAAYLVVVAGAVFAFVVLLANPQNRMGIHIFVDAFAIGGLIVIAALSGGQTSPAIPLIYLQIIHQAWFWRSHAVLWKLATFSLVIFAPISYDGFTGEGSVAISVAAYYSAFGTALILAGSLFVNQFSTARANAKAKRLAQTDALTRAPNRRAFNEFVEHQLDEAKRSDEFAIVMIDLDNFKEVNTAHGHRAGDELLKSIANALEEAARDGDCVARVGGDEFAAVLPGAGVDGARALAERFVAAVEECAKKSGDSASSAVTASAGFALHPLHGDSLDQLVRTADDALMAVKGSDKGTARVGRLVNAV